MFDTIKNNKISLLRLVPAPDILAYLSSQIYSKETAVAILAPTKREACALLGRLKDMLPRQRIVKSLTSYLELDNSSRVIAMATSSGAIRGLALDIVYIEGVAATHPNRIKYLIQNTAPVITFGENSKIIMNHGETVFDELWNSSANYGHYSHNS